MVSKNTEKVVNVFGAAAIFGLVELLATVLAAMLSSGNIISFLTLLIIAIPIIPLMIYYKGKLGTKLTIIAFIIGTTIIGGFILLFKLIF
jgi:hypothetical protein